MAVAAESAYRGSFIVDDIAGTAAQASAESIAAFPVQAFADLSAGLTDVSIGFVLHALRELGWNPAAGESVTPVGLVSKLGIVPRHQRLFGWLIGLLAEAGVLEHTSAGFAVRQPFPDAPLPDLGGLAAGFKDYAPVVEIVGRCGPELAGVLRGTVDPLHLLFPGGSFAGTEALYQDIPTARLFNGLVRDALVAAVSGRSNLRILEIGAGTGGTTAHILPELQSGAVAEYVFTDLSPLFLERAKEKFSPYPFLRYNLLDIEQDPAGQGFGGQLFDVILAANVLHATADLARTLAHVKTLLAPGGVLVLLEGTQPQSWVDLTFGLTEGWWKFTDSALRPDYPLLNRDGWRDFLRDQGFASVTMLPQVAPDSILNDQAVIIAGESTASSSAVSGDWLILADDQGVGQALADRLMAQGASCLCVTPGAEFAELDGHHWQMNPENPDDYRRVLAAADKWSGIVHLWSLNHAVESDLAPLDVESLAVADSGSVLLLTQALLARQTNVPLWLVTEGAQPVNTDVSGIAAASLWGMGRVIALEHPEIWGGLIDLEKQSGVHDRARLLLAEITLPDGEDQLALRAGERYVARLARTAAPQAGGIRFDSAGSYLITGGLGGLGLNLARWLADHGAGHLILTSRRGLPDRAQWSRLKED
ncbi:MAG: methyltransferase, partial [Anaerolineae bacterium]|nr:methyltransferase [Anaerolineae bacterium]